MATPLPASHRGAGLRVRFSAIDGVTEKGVLQKAMHLPCVLGDFTFSEEATHRDYETINAGEFSSPASGPATARRLRDVNLETLTVDWHAYAAWLVDPQLSPEDARRELYKILRSRSPFELLATIQYGMPEELRMRATLRGIERVLKPGEADTRYYSLTLREWRDNSIERRAAGHRGGGGVKLPTSHKLKPTTTLYGLAQKYYPNVPVRIGWRAIAEANGVKSWGPKTPLAESRRFDTGDKVTIPRKPPVARTGLPVRRAS